MVLTIPIFGVAWLVYGVDGWGLWAAVGLLAFWLILAGTSAAAQAKRDGLTARTPPPQAPWQRAAKIILFLIPLAVFARSAWLDQTGAPEDAIRSWRDGAALAWLVSFPLMMAVDGIAARLRSKS